MLWYGLRLVPWHQPIPIDLNPTNYIHVRIWMRIQYATDVRNLIFLTRLEFSCKTGCVPHQFQYKEVTCLFFPQNLRFKFFIIRFLTPAAYCIPGINFEVSISMTWWGQIIPQSHRPFLAAAGPQYHSKAKYKERLDTILVYEMSLHFGTEWYLTNWDNTLGVAFSVFWKH